MLISMSLVLALACCAGLQAQERATLRGRVVAADGKPWPRAEVVLHGRATPRFEWLGAADRLTIRTDERGRFRAQVIAGRGYLVWATGVSDAGRYRATEALFRVGAGQTLTLREQREVLVDVTVEIASPKDAVDGPPYRCLLTNEQDLSDWDVALGERWAGPDPMPLRVFEVEATGDTIRIPRLPWRSCTLEVYGKRGIRIVRQGIALGVKARRARLAPPKDAAAGAAILARFMPAFGEFPREKILSMQRTRVEPTVAAAREVRVVAKSRRGQAVADVAICQSIRGRLVEIAKTDAEGVCTLQVPQPERSLADFGAAAAGTRLVARAPGFVETYAVDSRELRRPWLSLFGRGDVVRKASGTPTIVLGEGQTLRGRLLRGGEPSVGTLLLLDIGLPPGAGYFGPGGARARALHVVRTDAEGRYVLPHLPRARYWLFAQAGSDFALISAKQLRRSQDLGTVDLAKLHEIVLKGERPDGAPALGSRLAVFDASVRPPQPLTVLNTVTDRRGTARVLVAEPVKWTIVAHDAAGYGIAELRAKTATTQAIRIESPPVLRGVVRDANGEPVVGVMVQTQFLFGHGMLLNRTLSRRFLSVTDDRGRYSVWARHDRAKESLIVMSFDRGEPKAARTVTANIDQDTKEDFEIEFNEAMHVLPALPFGPGFGRPANEPPAKKKGGKKG